MAKPIYTPELQSQYQRLFDTCIITTDRYAIVDSLTKVIVNHKARYERVGSQLNIPWYFIAIIHSLEGGSNFNTHLHNGDPLNARTVNVPAGRPKTGIPPFQWEESALDALMLKKLNLWTDWSVPGILYKLEEYNGFGYRRLAVPIHSPYLWSFSNHYTKGKFIKDGVYSPTAVSKQCGAAVLLRRLAEMQIGDYLNTDRFSYILKLAEKTKYAPKKYSIQAAELQKMLNLHGYHLKADGYAGKITSGIIYQITGAYLQGDPRKMT
ncbi:MAG: hypothetical protein MUF75_03315 [Bacteroidia bacterium]|jgi:lysozyme family protein|nr:hypothetical protein [Bacteroidia bacterium]